MINKYSLSLLLILCASLFGFGQDPWINEIHYDNAGADVNEGVEVAVPVSYSCGTNNLRLVFYNGGNGLRYSENNVPTTGTIVNGVRFAWVNRSGMQNGSPDGVALVCGTTVIQFLSYEGSFTAMDDVALGMTSADIGVQETGFTTSTESLQLQGTGCQYSDFTWAADITYTNANINTGQTINCSSSSCNITDISIAATSTCNDNSTPVDLTDDYYTADITITYANPPASGNIDLTGAGVYGGTTSAAITSSPQTISGVQLVADGNDVEITATFSAETTCNYTETVIGSGENSCSSSGVTTCANESFINIPSASPGNYEVRNWTGDDGINWTATDARTDQSINGNAILVRNGTLLSDTFTGGIGDLTVTTQRIFSGGSGNMNLRVNGTIVGSIPYDGTVQTTTISGIDIGGNITVEIDATNSSSDRVAIDDLTWTCFSCPSTPPDALNFTAVENCGMIDLSWDGTSCADEVLIVAREGSAVAAGLPMGDGSAYTADSNFSGSGSNLLSGKVVYKSNGNNISITGLTPGSTYHFEIFSRIAMDWSTGDVKTDEDFNSVIANPTFINSLNNCGDIMLEWDSPACYDEVLIVARATSQVSVVPTGDSTAYTANAAFASGDDLDPSPDGQYAVYRGTGNTTTITGLTDGVEYHFSIFSESGGVWSSGLDTSAFSTLSSSSGATDFDPGDLVFVGFDSYLGNDYTSSAEGDDILAIVSIVDIGPSTEFTIANLVYEWNAAPNQTTGRWYNCGTNFTGFEPPYATLQYNGCADIPMGTVICIGIDQNPAIINSIKVNGVTVSVTSAPDFSGDFVILDNPSHDQDNIPGNMSTSNPDTIWLMQGTFSDAMSDIGDGPDPDNLPDIYRTFTGDVLGGLQTKGSFQPLSLAGNNGGARVSRIHPDIECFYQETGSTSATAFYGYHNGLTQGTNYQLLQSITNNDDWVIASSDTFNADQNKNNLIDICNDNYKINGVTALTDGQWLGRSGAGGDDWFNCRNWENFNVPNTMTNVTINSSSTRDCVIDYDATNADQFSFRGDCNNLNISDYNLIIEDFNDVLHIAGNLTINGTGNLDMDGLTATDGQLLSLIHI